MTTALEGGEGSASQTGLSLPLGNTQYPLYRTGAENLTPTGIQSPDLPARSQSLYQRYLAHFSRCKLMLMASTKVVTMHYWLQCKCTPICRDIHIHVCTQHRWPQCGSRHSCDSHKLLVKNYIHVVYVRMRLNMNRIFEYFLKKGNSFTNWPTLAYIKHVQDQKTLKYHWSHNS